MKLIILIQIRNVPDLRNAFGVRFEMVDNDFDGVGTAMVIDMNDDISFLEDPLIIGDMVCLINKHTFPKNLTTELMNSQPFEDEYAVLSVMGLNPFRLLHEKNEDFITLLQMTERRHRMTLTRRHLLDDYPYGFVPLEFNVSDDPNNPVLFAVVFDVERQSALTGGAELYIGDVLASVEGQNVVSVNQIDFPRIIEALGKPRTLHVEFIPTSCLRDFSVSTELFTRNMERLRQPLNISPWSETTSGRLFRHRPVTGLERSASETQLQNEERVAGSSGQTQPRLRRRPDFSELP